MKHRWLKYSNVYINHDPVMTLTKFMARSALVAYAFEWGKLLKMSFEEKSQQDIGKWTNFDYRPPSLSRNQGELRNHFKFCEV